MQKKNTASSTTNFNKQKPMNDQDGLQLDVVPSELLQLLAEVGYVGVNKALFNDAQAIFNAIVAVRPQSDDAMLAKATALLFAGKVSEGTQLLFDLLKKDPSNDLAKSFLAVAFKMTKVDDYAVAAAEAVVKNGKNSSARSLAESLLAIYESEGKQAFSLADLQAQQVGKMSVVAKSFQN